MSEPILNTASDDESAVNLLDLLVVLAESWKLLIGGSLAAGLTALGISFFVTPIYTAKTSLIPPSLANSVTNSALRAELGGMLGMSGGGLAGLAGGSLRSPGDQYIAYLESNVVRDELIQKFDLMKRYQVKYLQSARNALKDRVKLQADKKSGLIVIEVDDEDPQFAAQLANDHVDALSRLIGRMTVGEARARRDLMEIQISEAMKKSYQSPSVREAVIQALIREYESARIDESRNHPFVIQVDPAKAPELKSRPKKSFVVVVSTIATFTLLMVFVFIRSAWRKSQQDPVAQQKWSQIFAYLKLK